MEQRIYQGTIDPTALAQHLLDTWDQGDTVAQALEGDEGIIVQVGQRSGGFFSDEPRNALTLALDPVSEGLRVTLGEQQWYRDGGGQIMVGGLIGFFPFFFTWPLGGGRDEPVDPQLTSQVWESVERYTSQSGGWGAGLRCWMMRSRLGEASRRWHGIWTGRCRSFAKPNAGRQRSYKTPQASRETCRQNGP